MRLHIDWQTSWNEFLIRIDIDVGENVLHRSMHIIEYVGIILSVACLSLAVFSYFILIFHDLKRQINTFCLKLSDKRNGENACEHLWFVWNRFILVIQWNKVEHQFLQMYLTIRSFVYFYNFGFLRSIFFLFSRFIETEQATDASLASENWALNMEICDMINESSDAARDAMKAIRKRLSQNAGKNYTVIMYTLTVLETCVKNCGKAFHLLVANKEFIQDLVKLIGPKNDPPAVVQEKVLNLIQIWADAFRSQPDLNGVVQVYQELKSKGIEFPVADLDAMAPIYTPQRVNNHIQISINSSFKIELLIGLCCCRACQRALRHRWLYLHHRRIIQM